MSTDKEQSDKSGEQYRKLFVGGLGPNTSDETLKSYFEQYGQIVDVVVIKDPNTSKTRGFGFVTFDTQDSIDAAQAARPHSIDGKQAETKRAIPKDDPAPENRYVSKQLFVGGLKREITKEQVEEYFSNFGVVSEVVLVKDKMTQVPRGFGFVTFEDADAVDKVIINKPHKIGDSKADVKKSLTKEEMLQLQAKQQSQQHGPPQHGGHDGGGYYNNRMPMSDGWQQQEGYYGGPGSGGYGVSGYGDHGGGYGHQHGGNVPGGWGNGGAGGGGGYYNNGSGYSNGRGGGRGGASNRRGGGTGGPMRGGRGGSRGSSNTTNRSAPY